MRRHPGDAIYYCFRPKANIIYRTFTSFSVWRRPVWIRIVGYATDEKWQIGNDHDEDSDKEPEPPVKVVDKTPARTTKRNAPAEAPASKTPAASEGRGSRRGGFSGNEGGS